MTIMGHINVRKRTGMVGGAPSRKLSLEGTAPSFKGEQEAVYIYYLSTTGMLVETTAPLSAGEILEILLPDSSCCPARVAWANENIFACQFSKPLKTATISAIKLQNPHEQNIADPVKELLRSDGTPEETLGERLKRLRQERGFTMTYLASRVGVSKPTLWKWEKGTVFPRQDMIHEIAEVLGVSQLELLYGSKQQVRQREKKNFMPFQTAEEVISASKSDIAGVMGIDPSQIKILIES